MANEEKLRYEAEYQKWLDDGGIETKPNPKKANKKSANDESTSGEPIKKAKIEAVKEEAQSTSGINDDSLPFVNVKEENLQNTTTNSQNTTTNSGTYTYIQFKFRNGYV